MYETWIESVKSSPLFAGLEDRSLGIMLECLKPRVRRCRQRAVVVTHGQAFQGIGIIASGRVALIKDTCSGNRIILGMLGAGEIFGEMMAFSDEKVWPVTVVSQEDSVILFLPPEKIAGPCSNICSSHSTLIMNMLRILSNRASLLNKKIEHISAPRIRGKVSRYLLDLSLEQNRIRPILPMRRHELADYLNVTRPSLSRELAAMRKAGIIKIDGVEITLIDMPALERFVG